MLVSARRKERGSVADLTGCTWTAAGVWMTIMSDKSQIMSSFHYHGRSWTLVVYKSKHTESEVCSFIAVSYIRESWWKVIVFSITSLWSVELGTPTTNMKGTSMHLAQFMKCCRKKTTCWDLPGLASSERLPQRLYRPVLGSIQNDVKSVYEECATEVSEAMSVPSAAI